VTTIRLATGVGARGTGEGTEVAVGRAGGGVEVAWDGIPHALVVLNDRLKPASAEAVRELEALGLTPILLTGDARARAEEVPRARLRTLD
jgi:Cu+-exporting ATPase